MKELTLEQISLLRKPLPSEAISQHPTRKFLSTIKAIYITERLNEVFGIGKWLTRVRHEISKKVTKIDKEKKEYTAYMVVVHTILEIPEYGIYFEQFGGNDNDDLGDAYKGAVTDAITKIASYLDIGVEVFKGNTKNDVRSFPPSKTVDNTTDYLKTVTGANNGQICKSCGVVVTNKVAEYSKSRWGKIYCMDCQSNTTINEDRTE